jgi:hypothetical protein
MKRRLNIKKLAKEAYEVGRKAALKAWNQPTGYENRWSDMPVSSQIGFKAIVRFIAKKLKQIS